MRYSSLQALHEFAQGRVAHAVKPPNLRFSDLGKLFKPGKSSLSQCALRWFRKPFRHCL